MVIIIRCRLKSEVAHSWIFKIIIYKAKYIYLYAPHEDVNKIDVLIKLSLNFWPFTHTHKNIEVPIILRSNLPAVPNKENDYATLGYINIPRDSFVSTLMLVMDYLIETYMLWRTIHSHNIFIYWYLYNTNKWKRILLTNFRHQLRIFFYQRQSCFNFFQQISLPIHLFGNWLFS